MFSLQKLLGKEDKFFDLLEASAEEARASVQALVKLARNPDQTTLLYEFIQARRKEKQIRAQISEAVYTTFVTALEREDIENLSHALYRIPKTVEKFGERLLLTPQHVKDVDFSKTNQSARTSHRWGRPGHDPGVRRAGAPISNRSWP